MLSPVFFFFFLFFFFVRCMQYTTVVRTYHRFYVATFFLFLFPFLFFYPHYFVLWGLAFGMSLFFASYGNTQS